MRPPMRLMANNAFLVRIMHGPDIQDLTGMAAQAVFVHRFDPIMGLMTLVTVQPGHRDLVGERCPARFPVTAQTPFSVWNEHAGLPR
jgi:hypothetical protein